MIEKSSSSSGSKNTSLLGSFKEDTTLYKGRMPCVCEEIETSEFTPEKPFSSQAFN